MLVIAIVFLLLVVIFAVQNAQMVPLNFLAWSIETNQALVVLGAASLGVIIGAIWVWVKNLTVRSRIKELNKELAAERQKTVSLERALQDAMMANGSAEVDTEDASR
jgi:putative membrane protein